ncbi:MAG: helix-turn-helix domain-containing protein [Actinomycetota bacterium]
MNNRLTYSVTETAERLGIGRTLTYRLIGTGELPSIKVAGRRLVTERQIQHFLATLERSG